MTNSRFLRVSSALRRHRALVLILFGVVVAASFLRLRRIEFENSLSVMLPQDESVQRTIRFLQEAKMSDKVVISLRYEGGGGEAGAGAGETELIAAADELTKRMTSALIRPAMSGMAGKDFFEGLTSLAAQVPAAFREEDAAWVDSQLNAEAIDKVLKARYRQILKPEGSFLASGMRSDPLGLQNRFWARMKETSAWFGYRVRPIGGHLVSEDGRHLMLIFETPIRMTDARGSERLMAYLRRKTAALPESVTADVICGHAYTVSNANVIKRDIGVTSAAESIFFLLLFLAWFRDVRAMGAIFVIPFVAVLMALNLVDAIIDRMSALVVGLGTVIVGIAIDYGVHVYTAKQLGDDPDEAVREISRPLIHGSFTTLGVFAAFFFSSIEGYRQLAWFSILSILLSLALALFILPLVLRKTPRSGVSRWGRRGPGRPWSRSLSAGIVAVFAAMVAVAGFGMTKLSFDSNLLRLDGTQKDVLDTEKRFREVWGGGDKELAMAVVRGATEEQGEERNARLLEDLSGALPGATCVNFATIWPGRASREANARRWKDFWTGERGGRVRSLLTEGGKKYGFKGDAFDPFFAMVERAPNMDAAADHPTVAGLRERFVREHDGVSEWITYFPDRPELVKAAGEAVARHPGAFLVSRSQLGIDLSGAVSRQVVRVSMIGSGLVILLTFVMLRHVRMALVALVPSMAGVGWLLGGMGLLGMPLNIANLIAGCVVFGLCIDYGIFMAHSQWHRLQVGTETAITVSVVTTLVGTGVLIFARHPTLFSIGSTLTAGVLSGYVAGVLVVPALCSLMRPPAPRDGRAGEGGAERARRSVKNLTQNR